MTVQRPMKQGVRRRHRQSDGAGAEGDLDRFRARARPPEALHNGSGDAEQDRFGQAEQNDAHQDGKEINRKGGKYRREPDFQARGQERKEEITPEFQGIRRPEVPHLDGQAERSRRKE